MDNVLELVGVSYLYGKGTPFEKKALNNVNVGFKRGRVTGLIGHTGSGKSTLISLLNGLLKPTSGTVMLNGVDIWQKPKEISSVRFKVGLVMQYPEYQLFDETVRLDIGYAPRNLGLKEDEISARVNEAARFAGISESLMNSSPFELSGGQKRRVAIAGVIAMHPDVLVLDEPAAGLDPRGRREILTGLRNFAYEKGTTVILVSHSMEDMAYYCDDIVVMNHGEIAMQGSVGEVFSKADALADCGLDVPDVAKIAKRLTNAGINLVGELYTVDGVKDAILKHVGGAK